MTLLALSSLALAACSSVSVESQARLPQPAPAFIRTLVVVALPAASRSAAEDTLVAQLPSLHPSTSYSTVALKDGITLGALRERARQNGFDGLLVVWVDVMTLKDYPALEDIPGSTQIGLRVVASLTALDGDREIWKAIATHRDSSPFVKHMPETMSALADRLHKDGVAN
jgi:hypothetical protein